MTFSVFPILRNLRYVQTIPDSFRVEHEQQRLQAAQQATSEFQKPSLSKWGQVHNLSCENEFYLHENEKSFSYQRLNT